MRCVPLVTFDDDQYGLQDNVIGSDRKEICNVFSLGYC